MTHADAVRARCLAWLESGTENQQALARVRLAALDAAGPAATTPPPEPWPACHYRESCACTGGDPICYHRDYGPRYGAESTHNAAAGPVPVRRVQRADCLRCESARGGLSL